MSELHSTAPAAPPSGASSTATTVIDQLEGFLQHDPTNTGLIRELVNTALAAGQPERAHRVLAPLLADGSARGELVHLGCLVNMAQARWGEALEQVQSLMAQGHNHPGIRFNHATCLLRLQRFDEAASAFAALLTHPTEAPPGSLAGHVTALHHLGRLADAVQAWRGSPATVQDDLAQAAAALVLLDTGELETAVRLARSLPVEGPLVSVHLMVEATAALARGESDRAWALMSQPVALPLQEPRSWSLRGAAALAVGQVDQARLNYQRWADAQPDSATAWMGLGWCALVSGEESRAATCFRQARDLRPQDAKVHLAEAVAAARSGREQDARAAMQRLQAAPGGGALLPLAESLSAGEVVHLADVHQLVHRFMEQTGASSTKANKP